MKKNYFLIEFIKSGPFILLLILAILIMTGILISKQREKAVKMKEDVLYIAPKPKN